MVMLRRVDSETVHNSATATDKVCVDGGKKIKGRKRFFVVDSQGHLLFVQVVPACHHDGSIALNWWHKQGRKTPLLSDITRIYGDTHFGGKFKKGVEASSSVCVITSPEQIGVTDSGMKLHKRRRVVERTLAWNCAPEDWQETSNERPCMLKLSVI